MQFILSEEEYKKLIHKDRLKQPIDEFIKSLEKTVRAAAPYSNEGVVDLQMFKDAIKTLSIKLDL